MVEKNLKVALFSQNTITNYETIFNKLSFSSKPTIPELTDEVPDIFVEMSQEDSRITTGVGLGSIIEHKALNYKKQTIALNMMGGIDKNVIMQLYYKPELINNVTETEVTRNDIEHGTIELEHKKGKGTNSFYATKGAVYIYISIKGYNPLLFINMHFSKNRIAIDRFLVFINFFF